MPLPLISSVLRFANQGAVCVAGTRLLIQESMKEELLPKVLERAKKTHSTGST